MQIPFKSIGLCKMHQKQIFIRTKFRSSFVPLDLDLRPRMDHLQVLCSLKSLSLASLLASSTLLV